MKTRIHFVCEGQSEQTVPIAAAMGVGTHSDITNENGRFAPLLKMARNDWVKSDAASADIFMLASEYEPGSHIDGEIATAARFGKPIVIFYGHEEDQWPLELPIGVIYRTSLRRSRKQSHERPWVAFAADPLSESAQTLQPRPWTAKPSVGFCGYVGTRWTRLAYGFLGRSEKALGLRLRHAAVIALESDARLEPRFILRDKFWAGQGETASSDAERRRVRQEFLGNLIGCDYALCLRGQGNFSFRLYEALAAGRIPLFIDTDCSLPFETQIDWKHHVVWVPEADLANAADILMDFHQNIGAAGFEDLQRRNRQLWLDWFETAAAYSRLISAELPGGVGSL
jgi:hypothetical protein